MKSFAVALCLTAVLLASMQGADAIKVGFCKRLSRRQRQLTARDDYPGVSCVNSNIVSDVNAACENGLCSSLNRRNCKIALRDRLVTIIFPAHCSIVTETPTCSAEVCTSTTCRSTFLSGVAYPGNCPETCVTTGLCPVASCVPNVPTCGTGFVLNQSTCSCVAVIPPDCTRDAQCVNINECRPGVCTDDLVCETFVRSNCCINDKTGTGIDTECSITSPVCGNSNNRVVASGARGSTCYFCEDDRTGTGIDNGCSATTPFCGSGGGSNVGSDGLGDRCFSCQATSSAAPDTSCDLANPFCSLSVGLAVGTGNYGDNCRKCINDGNGVDSGCSSASPNCNALPGRLGLSCIQCQNTAPGAGTDFGCGVGAPICASATGTAIGVLAFGAQCVECIDEPSLTQLGVANGCTTLQPRCGAMNTCSFCTKSATLPDFGCGAESICTNVAGTVLLNVGDEGSMCALCQNDNSAMDPGCTTVGMGVCEAEFGKTGSACRKCQNTVNGGIDIGCDAALPNCNALTDQFGDVCIA